MSSAADRIPSPDPASTPRDRRQRGRPKLLDAEQILSMALAMLQEQGPAAFSMGKLAQRLGASAMTLYTYFPSREALLDAAAGKIFSSFDPPAETLPWREALLAWTDQLYAMFMRHPIGLRLIKWDGAVTPSWLRVWMPLVRILDRAGLSGPALLIAANWVGRVSIALLMVRIAAKGEAASLHALALEDDTLDAADRALLLQMSSEPNEQWNGELDAFGRENILRGVEALLR